jgi:putative membrane protein
MRRITDYILIFFKGSAMGAADVVPGVSGGTIALISGIYEELLQTISSVRLSLFKVLFKEGIGAFWKKVNGNFLLALLSGIAVSILSLAKLFSWLLREHPVPLWAFFFGLVLASVPMVVGNVKNRSIKLIPFFILGTAFALSLSFLPVSKGNTELWFVFVSGMVAICAMILPGISGSFILLIMGMYQYILGALNDRDIPVILIFMSGCVVGLLGFSRVLSWLFKKYHDITIALMSGFLLGSLLEIWPWKKVLSTRVNSKGEEVPFLQENILPESETLLIGILMMATGLVLVFTIERLGRKYSVKQKA